MHGYEYGPYLVLLDVLYFVFRRNLSLHSPCKYHFSSLYSNSLLTLLPEYKELAS